MRVQNVCRRMQWKQIYFAANILKSMCSFFHNTHSPWRFWRPPVCMNSRNFTLTQSCLLFLFSTGFLKFSCILNLVNSSMKGKNHDYQTHGVNYEVNSQRTHSECIFQGSVCLRQLQFPAELKCLCIYYWYHGLRVENSSVSFWKSLTFCTKN